MNKRRKEGKPKRKPGEKGYPGPGAFDRAKSEDAKDNLLGTPELTNKYKKDTPGQKVEGFKEFIMKYLEQAPNTADAMKRHKAGKAGFTDKAHLKAKGLIPRSDGEKRKSDKYK